jgi:hypothetical protein
MFLYPFHLVWLETGGALRCTASGATLVFATGARFDDVPQLAKAEMTTAAMMTSLLPA